MAKEDETPDEETSPVEKPADEETPSKEPAAGEHDDPEKDEKTEAKTDAKSEVLAPEPPRKQEETRDKELDAYLKEKEAILGEGKKKDEEVKEGAAELAGSGDRGKEPREGETREREPATVSGEPPVPEMIVPEESYLTAGVHIGTQQKSAHMKPFLYRVRNDGLFVLNVKLTDRKILAASKFLARFEPGEILVVSARQYGQRPVRKMAEALGNMVLPGRFVPGTLTNPNISQYIEPKVMVVTDPAADAQAMREAISTGIPIVGICDANNLTKYVDLIIPGNNKGRKALALIYFLLARTILKEKGELTDLSEFPYQPEDFEESL